MKMDNSDLKKKAAETTGLFGKLKKSLSRVSDVDLSRTSRSIGDISNQSRRMDMDPLARSLQTVTDRFSALGVIGTTALVNITNRAVNAGLALQKSLTTDQVAAGFKEYEMKIGSIKTILANTEWNGTGLGEVKTALNELNEYADQTIYNFAQMTENIGRFTTAGINLDDATVAIKGLGNLAAISGSTSHQLNSAMYQMSQAMQQPYMMLMDWRSLQNAGMGGKRVKDALLENAKAMGINVDMSKGFNLSLEQGWLTTELFLKTMRQFGEDESMIDAATKVRTFSQMMDTLKEEIGSGWAETWELIFGDFEDATRLWTAVSEMVKKPFQTSTKARNDFLRAIIAGDGFVHILSTIANTAKPIIQVFRAVGDGFRSAFPPLGIDRINSLAKTFSEFTKGLQLSEKSVSNLTTIFGGIFAIFSSLWEITKALTQAVFGLLPNLRDLGGGLLEIWANTARVLISINEGIKSGSLFSKTMDILGVSLAVVGLGISHLGEGLEWVADLFRPLADAISTTFGGDHISETNEELTTMKGLLSPITNFFKGMFESIVNGFNWVKDKLVSFGNMIKDALPDGRELFAGGFIAALIAVTGNAIMMGWKLWNVFTGWGEIGAEISGVLEQVGGALRAFSMNLYSAALIKVAIALAILAGSLYLIQNLGYEEIAQGLYAMIGGLTGLILALGLISKYNMVAQMSSVTTIVAMSLALLILAGAFKRLKDLDVNEISKGVYALVASMSALTLALTVMSKYGGKAIGASSLQFLALAGSVHIMVAAIKKIAEIDESAMKEALKTLAIILVEIAVFMNLMRGSKFGIGSTLGMLAIGKAIDNVVQSIVKMSTIDPQALKEGLKTVAIILTAIGLFAIATSFGNLFVAGAGMLVISFALQQLIKPITSLSVIPWTELSKGLFGMTMALLGIAAAGVAMTGTIGGAVAMLIMAGALNAIVGPIVALSKLSLGEIGKSLLAILGVLVLAGVASALLSPTIPTLMLFGTALTLVGVGMLAAGAGMALFGTGLLALSTLSVGAITTIIATLGTLLSGLISLAPLAANFIGDIMLKVMNAIHSYVPRIVAVVIDFLITMIHTIANRIPEFIEAGTNLIVNFINGIAEAYPRVVEAAANLIITYVEAMADAVETNGPRLTDAIMRLFGNVLLIMIDAGTSMVNALFGWIPGVKSATASIGSTAEEYIRENFRSGIVASEKGGEFASSLEGMSDAVNNSGVTLAEAAQSGMTSIDMTSDGANFGIGFANGIQGTLRTVGAAASSLASRAASAVRDFLDIRSPARLMDDYGGYTGQGFANGISKSAYKVDKSASSLAGRLMDFLGIKSEPVKTTSKAGEAAGENFSKGLSSTTSSVSRSSRSVGKSAAQSASEGFREEMETARYQFDIGEIDADQYISEIKKIRDRYSKHVKLVREANLKIKDLEEEIVRRKEDLRRKEFRDAKDLIDDKKYYNELSLADELKAWETIMAATKKGTEERKQAEREVYKLKNELNDKIIEINEEYVTKIEDTNQRLIDGERQLNDEYERALSDRTRALTGFAGLFDEVSKDTKVSGQELINNLRDQVGTFQSWSNNMQSLAERGIDKGLLEELRQMGPRSAAEIAALNRLTNTQLNEYAKLWQQKNNSARHQASGELEGLKDDTVSKIEELRNDTQEQLESYKTEWASKIEEIRDGTADQFVGLDDDMNTVGSNVISGLIEGMSDMEGPLVNQAKSMAESISQTIKDTLEIRSPSRVAMKDGGWFGEGFARGMADKVKRVGSSAKELATTAKDSIHKFIDGFAPEDNELHFKAVVDYDKFDPNGFGKPRPIPVVPDTSFTSGMASATRRNIGQNEDKTTREKPSNPVEYNSNYEINVTANGNLSKSQIRKLAEDIQTEIKNINDRTKLSRGEGVAF